MVYMLKYDRIDNLILLCVILGRNVTTLEFVYIYLLTAFTQVLLAKFVVSAFLDYKSM